VSFESLTEAGMIRLKSRCLVNHFGSGLDAVA